MENKATSLAREFREMCRKKSLHSLESLKHQLDQWRAEFNLEPRDYINFGNSHGKTALHFAAQLRDDGLTEYLLSIRADPNATTVRGHTALIFASGRGRSDTVLSLLEAGSKTRVRIVNGDTALSMGAAHGLDEKALAALRESECKEIEPWLDFTQDQLAIEAQADHVMAKPQCAQWSGDVPQPVADLIKQRAEAKSKRELATQVNAEMLAKVLHPLWNDEEAFAEALLLECCKPSSKKRAQVTVRDSLQTISSTLSGQDLRLFIVILLHFLSKWLPELSRRSALKELGPKQVKYGKTLATSAVLCTLKETSPLSCGITIETLAAESPPWAAVEILTPPNDVILLSDLPHLEFILRKLCHAEAWGSDFGTALRWLRMLRPGADASKEETAAFLILADAYVHGAVAACRAGHSLKRHLRDNSSLLDEVEEVLSGAKLDSLHEAFAVNAARPAANMKLADMLITPPAGPPFLELPPQTNIVWISDAEAWSQAENKIQASKLVAIDTEWWDVGMGPALIQIAIGSACGDDPTCFLVDTWHGNCSETSLSFRRDVGAGLVRLFSSDLQVVGWSFEEDAKRLRELCGSESSGCAFPVLDLQSVSSSLFASSQKAACKEGLAVTCARFLGKPLDKTEQCSDWRLRPLRDAQQRYAALDAIVLLELHSVLDRFLNGSFGKVEHGVV